MIFFLQNPDAEDFSAIKDALTDDSTSEEEDEPEIKKEEPEQSKSSPEPKKETPAEVAWGLPTEPKGCWMFPSLFPCGPQNPSSGPTPKPS